MKKETDIRMPLKTGQLECGINEKANCWRDCGRSFFIVRVFVSCKGRHNKDRNGKDLTEAEEIKKRWQEYTEELY